MEEIISSIEEKIAGNICKEAGSVNYNLEEIISLIEEKVAGDIHKGVGGLSELE